MHWEDEFRCSLMIWGKFNAIFKFWWFSAHENILEPVSEMRAIFEQPSNRRQNFRLSAGVKGANRVLHFISFEYFLQSTCSRMCYEANVQNNLIIWIDLLHLSHRKQVRMIDF